MTQAQRFVSRLTTTDIDGIAAHLTSMGARLLGCFKENTFYELPDGSRLIVSEPAGGHRLVRSAPAITA